MKRPKNGFALQEIFIGLSIAVMLGFGVWHIFLRPSWISRQQLNGIADQIKLPSFYKFESSAFEERHPGFDTIFSLSRTYQITKPTTRSEALKQMVSALGLNPQDNHKVDIYEEQLTGVNSPLFPASNGSEYKFLVKFKPSYLMERVEECDGIGGSDIEFRACINNTKKWGREAPVEKIEIIIEKVPK